jgi:hypothetical protein
MGIEDTLQQIVDELAVLKALLTAPRAESIGKKEAAMIFGVSERSVDEYEKAGLINRQVWAAGVRYSRQEVVAAAAKGNDL